MQETQAVNQINETVQQAIAGGVTAAVAIQALTMLLAVGAIFIIVWKFTKSQNANSDALKSAYQTFEAVSTKSNERFAEIAEQANHIQRDTNLQLARNSDTREANTIAINDWKNAQVHMVEAVQVLTADINSRQSLTEGSVSGLSDRVQMLINETRAGNVQMERLTAAVNRLPSDYEQNAAAIRALIAEWHQLYEMIINTLRPPKSDIEPTPPALQTTLTPETSE